ncbi:MAG: hypothetical protein ACKO4Z_12955 [Planctomycetota bacterium]|nr:hypothetical protein [Planctomycetota bacterium]
MTPFGSVIRRLGSVVLLLLASCGGCNKSPFALVPVSGTVLLDGKPLAGGVINFQPIATGTSTNGGPGSTARINAEGGYSLATISGLPGAVVGKHRVKIYSYSPESPAVTDGAKATTQREQVPARYNYKSDVTFDVPAAGTDKADFSIKSK